MNVGPLSRARIVVIAPPLSGTQKLNDIGEAG
jgi:hypothetical protein